MLFFLLNKEDISMIQDILYTDFEQKDSGTLPILQKMRREENYKYRSCEVKLKIDDTSPSVELHSRLKMFYKY